MRDPNVTFNVGNAPTNAKANNGSAGGHGFIIDSETIQSLESGSATGGVIDWVAYYVPLESGGSLFADRSTVLNVRTAEEWAGCF